MIGCSGYGAAGSDIGRGTSSAGDIVGAVRVNAACVTTSVPDPPDAATELVAMACKLDERVPSDCLLTKPICPVDILRWAAEAIRIRAADPPKPAAERRLTP